MAIQHNRTCKTQISLLVAKWSFIPKRFFYEFKKSWFWKKKSADDKNEWIITQKKDCFPLLWLIIFNLLNFRTSILYWGPGPSKILPQNVHSMCKYSGQKINSMLNLQVRWFSLHFSSKICTQNGNLSMECSKVRLVCINLLCLYTVKFHNNTPVITWILNITWSCFGFQIFFIMEFYKGIKGKWPWKWFVLIQTKKIAWHNWRVVNWDIKHVLYKRSINIICIIKVWRAQWLSSRVLDLRVVSLRLTEGSVLCPWGSHFILCLVRVQPRKTKKHPDVTEKLLTGM